MKEDIQKELKELDSILAEKDKPLIYKSNDEYFRRMQDSVIIRSGLKRRESGILKLIKTNVSGIAASILLIVGVYLVYQKFQPGQSNIAHNDAYQYLSDNLDHLDEDVLIKYMDESILVLEEESLPDDKSIENFFEENPENLDDIYLEQLF